jgi:hypothetical protein
LCLGAVLCALGASACDGDVQVRARPARPAFIALERDFGDFRAWGSFVVEDVKQQGSTHAGGHDRLFVNALPPEPGASFPVGTMIVKETQATLADGRHLFAMAKRGAGFNARGARGWEWFELKERDDASVAIMWRGVGAPKGEEYGGDPLGTCNDCHSMAKENDYVQAERLRILKPALARAGD